MRFERALNPRCHHFSTQPLATSFPGLSAVKSPGDEVERLEDLASKCLICNEDDEAVNPDKVKLQHEDVGRIRGYFESN